MHSQPPENWLAIALMALLLFLILVKVSYSRQRASPERADELIPGLLSVHEAYEGVLGIGGTGSGKSSSMAHLMLAMMKRGFGMLILTAKADDYDAICKMAARAGRLPDVRRFSPDEKWRLDFLNYEINGEGGSVAAAAQLMHDMVDFSMRTNSMQSDEPFWPMAAARKIHMSMTIVHHATGRCGIGDLYRFTTSMPNTAEQRDNPAFHETFCAQTLVAAAKKGVTPEINLASEYVLSEWPRLSDKTGGCIDAYVMNLLEKFMHGHVRTLVASDETNLTPDDVLNGKIVVVDMPVLKFREPGQFVQMAWKLMVQRAALRRIVGPDSLPAVIWADEAQLHALPKVDSMTQAVARSHKLIQVAITQNLPLVSSVLGSWEDAISWLSNLQTKFIFANGDNQTNDYFSAMLGQHREIMIGGGTDAGEYDVVGDAFGGSSGVRASANFNEQWLPVVRPELFQRMRRGGKACNFIVDAYVVKGAGAGQGWVQTSFKQMV